ncbi:transposase [Frankia sp. Mgl5]|nr:transposase [Frankia sp. Mgl5]MCK9931604.1 transposase [Frankia sp. Mgl5]
MRGAWVDEKTQVKLLAAMIHGRGLVVGQVRVPDDTNEITKVENLLDQLPEMPGRSTVTLDAVHTQDDTTKDIVKHGMDYVMIAKGNRPTLERQTF